MKLQNATIGPITAEITTHVLCSAAIFASAAKENRKHYSSVKKVAPAGATVGIRSTSCGGSFLERVLEQHPRSIYLDDTAFGKPRRADLEIA